MPDAAAKAHLAGLMQAADSLLNQTERMPDTVTKAHLAGLMQAADSLLDQTERVLDRAGFETIKQIR